MIDLYLIRHGIAAERGTYANDGDRPLTKAGLAKTRKIAQRLRQLNLRVDLILTSPLVRARQTADILLVEQISPRLEEFEPLSPEGCFETWLDWFQTWRTQGDRKALALVGHEPDLGIWTERLVWGEAKEHLVVKKAGVIGLQVPETQSPIGNCHLFWFTPPRFLLES